MPYTIPITDARQRDAAVTARPGRRPPGTSLRTPDGRKPEAVRLIKATEATAYAALLAACDDDPDRLAQALIDGDPEVPLEQLGRHMGEATRVWLRHDGAVLYAARVLRITSDPFGTETGRQDFVDVEATVGSEVEALPWTGRLLPRDEVVHRFVLVRKLQLQHVNGLTYDFLYDMARQLQESDSMLVVGSGRKGNQPLIFTRNGAPYRGFLEGRIDGPAYRLVLHLSNCELKAPPSPPEEA